LGVLKSLDADARNHRAFIRQVLGENMNLGTIYLLVAIGLLFGAGFFAAKRVFPLLRAKQVGIIALVAIVTVGVIWKVLDLTGRKQETTPLTPATQPLPLQPGQDPP
jgi:hypothetical protein